jgi:GntR family transcriptional regulator
MVFKIIENFDSDTPIYIQIKNYIKNQILEGPLKVGDIIPPERVLSEQFGISRITIRQAISILVTEGYLIKKQGKGTFVTHPGINNKILSITRNLSVRTIKTISEEIIESGLIPSSIVLLKEVGDANDDIAHKLALYEKNRKVNKVLRIRCTNNEPLLVERTFVPYYLCSNLIDELEDGSILRTLNNKFKFPLEYADISYQAVLVNKEDANLLHYIENGPGLLIERITYLNNGVPIEYVQGVARGDRIKLNEKANIEYGKYLIRDNVTTTFQNIKK